MTRPDRGGTGTAAGVPGATARLWRQRTAECASPPELAVEMMLDLAEVGSGSRVLDVAAGAGGQTLAAAHRVGPTGSVLAVDLDGKALGVAAARAHAADLGNVRTRVMDACHLDLRPDSFDAAICCCGLEFFSDLERALLETRRVLKPGRKLAGIVWSAAEKNPRVSLPLSIARRYCRQPSPEPGQGGMFSLGSTGVLAKALIRAGFHDVAVRPFPTCRRFPSTAEAVSSLRRSFPLLALLMASLSEATRLLAWAEISLALGQFQGPDGFEVAGELLLGVGTT